MAKRVKKVKPPLVKIVFRGAASHTEEQVAAIHTWVALKMLDYHRDRQDFDDICTMRHFS